MTLELTMEEARQVDWALAHRQDRLSEMVQQSVPELAMVYRDELEACNSVIHKLAPMFANAEGERRAASARTLHPLVGSLNGDE